MRGSFHELWALQELTAPVKIRTQPSLFIGVHTRALRSIAPATGPMMYFYKVPPITVRYGLSVIYGAGTTLLEVLRCKLHSSLLLL